MNWFYALNGQQAGPVDDAELERLVHAGTVAPGTLVWCSGMAQWLPYAEARRTIPPADLAAASAPSAATATAAPAAASTLSAAAQAQCSQCGRVLPADEIVRVDNLNVCGQCKPMLLQRMREGAPVYNATVQAVLYAGFWIRVGAACLDGIITIPIYAVLFAGLWFFTDLHNIVFTNPQPESIARLTRSFLPFSFGFQFLLGCYSAFCINRFGGTPGKRICNLRVVHGNAGERVTFLRGLGRFATKMVPRSLPSVLAMLLAGSVPTALPTVLVYLVMFIDVIFIVFDEQKRALHDRVCDTRVVEVVSR